MDMTILAISLTSD